MKSYPALRTAGLLAALLVSVTLAFAAPSTEGATGGPGHAAPASAPGTAAPAAPAPGPVPASATIATAATTGHATAGQSTHATRLSTVTIAIGAVILALLLAGAHRYARTGLQRRNIATRLTAGFAAILLVLTGLVVESYVSLHSSLVEFTEYRDDARQSRLAADIQTEFREMRIAAKDLVIFHPKEPIQRYTAHKDTLLRHLRQGETEFPERELLEKIRAIETAIVRHVALHVELQKAVAESETALAAATNKQMGELGSGIIRDASAIEQAVLAQQNEAGPRIAAELQHTQSTVVWLGLAAIVLGAGLATIIARSITGPLRLLAQSLGAGADQTAAAAGQVSAASQTLAEGASEQAAGLEETSASLEELSSMTKRNADSSQQARQSATGARGAADTGATQMQAMQAAMQAIKSASEDITKILKTIDEIAFQTNILALNAAVEAARAGEHGMGFAVVAEEVRALAQRSALAARETAAKIEDSVNKSQQGVRISADVAKNFAEIQAGIQALEHLVGEIATASGEQSQGIDQVTSAVSQMDQVTQTNAASAEETAAAAEELNSQSVMLKDAVARLQLLAGTASDSTAVPAPSAPARPSAPRQPRLAKAAKPAAHLAPAQ